METKAIKEGEITQEVNTSTESINFVLVLLEELEKKLNEVLSPDSECCENENKTEKYIATSLGIKLKQNNVALNEVINKIQSIQNRICL